jgi:hypothetical protein
MKASAIGERTQLVIVADSLGGFTARIVCTRVPVELLVMLNAMIGEDDAVVYYHDVPLEVVALTQARRAPVQSVRPVARVGAAARAGAER